MRFSVFSKRSSTLALALALGMGGVLSVTALEAPAAAQKKKKGDNTPLAAILPEQDDDTLDFQTRRRRYP